MASTGVSVSRSGRVRKKSAKLIEMENESTNVSNNGNIINNNNGNNNSGKTPKNVSMVSPPIQTPIVSTPVVVPHIPIIDSDYGKPLKKKLKIKLSLGMSSNEVPQQLPVINDKAVDPPKEEPKKATIPPLKIPKSKLLTKNLVPLTDSCDKQITAVEQNTTETTSERKEKPSSSKKFKITVKELNETKFSANVENKPIDSTPVIIANIDNESETNENITSDKVIDSLKHNESVKVSINNDIVNNNTNNITDTSSVEITAIETPKPNIKKSKPKKKEHESAANRLFRQITSGVTPPQVKSKFGKKSISIPDISSITSYDDYEESSLVIATEEPLSTKKPKINRSSRQFKSNESNRKDVRKPKRSRKLVDGEKPKKKRSVITAYMLWSKEHRSKIQQTSPDMDFADVSRKLGEIWQSMPKNEKTQWKRKAQKLKASALISTGKPNTSCANITKTTPFSDSYALSSLDNDDYLKHDALIGTSPIDVAAHLKLLGESLNIIGQRLKEHSGQIAVSGSLSVLLDSTLCAIGPLLCLTSLEPKLDGCDRDTHKNTLDNIAYIMPGI